MTCSSFLARFSLALCLLGCLALAYGLPQLADPAGKSAVAPDGKTPTTLALDQAKELIRRQPGFFVPNLGQWEHRARFVHRSGPMTLFLQDRGWVVELVEHPVERRAGPHKARTHEPRSSAAQQAMPSQVEVGVEVEQKIRGVAMQMTFEGDDHTPEIVGEAKLNGHHNYFLGNNESRWRTGVPLYASVRYKSLYPGIDLRMRQMNGVPEYDLLLQPGADLSLITVHVDGAQSLSIVSDGSLVIETALGRLTQPMPRTWQVDGDGNKRRVACYFTLLGTDRFGFEAPSWDGYTSLTIDPGLIWSTFLGGDGLERAHSLSVDAGGVVTLAGYTKSINLPMTGSVFATIHRGGAYDAFISRLDPKKTRGAQLVYSTFLGGSNADFATALSVDASGVVTVAGGTKSTNYPTTSGAYDTSYNGGARDAFVSRLDPSQTGTAQLVCSTFLGGRLLDWAHALSVDASGVVTVAGDTNSINFPTTRGAFDTTYNGGSVSYGGDVFVSRLDMGVALWADTHLLSLKQAGTQGLTLNAGKQHAGRPYWIFGSMTGTVPGVTLNGVHMPLNPDQYTGITIAFPNVVIQNMVVLKNFKGTLDNNGRASASFNLPKVLPQIPFTLYHAYLVYDAQGTWHTASNPVPLRLVN